jgi:hypothetical protein
MKKRTFSARIEVERGILQLLNARVSGEPLLGLSDRAISVWIIRHPELSAALHDELGRVAAQLQLSADSSRAVFEHGQLVENLDLPRLLERVSALVELQAMSS